MSTIAIFYTGLNKVYLVESKNPESYLRNFKYKLRNNLVKGEVQNHFNKGEDKFEYYILEEPLEKVYDQCEEKGYNFYIKRSFAGLPVK